MPNYATASDVFRIRIMGDLLDPHVRYFQK